MQMTIIIQRSAEYCRARKIETGENVYEMAEAAIDSADLTAEARNRIVEWWGKYPERLDTMDISQTGAIELASGGATYVYPGNLRAANGIKLAADIEPHELTPEHVAKHLEDIERQAAEAREKYLAPLTEIWPAYQRDGVSVFLRRQDISVPSEVIAEFGRDATLSGWNIPTTISDVLCREHHDIWEAAIAERNNRNKRLAEEARDKALKLRAEREAVEAEAKARKHDQLTEAVERLGSENQQARWADGLMSPAEAVALIEAEALAPLKDMEIYEQDAVGGDESRYGDVSYLTAEEYAQAQRIYEALPSAGLTYHRVTARGDYDVGTGEQYYWTVARARLEIGEIVIVKDVVLRHWTREIEDDG